MTDSGESCLLSKAPINFSPLVLNRHKLKAWETGVYVGRGTPWGNPFRVGDTHPTLGHIANRDIAVKAHSLYLSENPELVNKAKKLLWGRNLICSCAPLSCHVMNFFELFYNSPSAQDFVNRRLTLLKEARVCPRCKTDQVQVVDWLRSPALWHCKLCKNKYGKKTSFFFEPGQTVAPKISDYIHAVRPCRIDFLSEPLRKVRMEQVTKQLRLDGFDQPLVSLVVDVTDHSNTVLDDIVF